MQENKILGLSSAILLDRAHDVEIKGQLSLTTAPFGVEMGTPFLLDQKSQTIYPMSSVKVMRR